MREITYSNPSKYRGLYCPNVLARCVDVRFYASLERVLTQSSFIPMGGVNDFISMGVPGGSKAIIDAPTRPIVSAAVDIAIRRHDANRLIIADHIDCAAYGGSDRHANAAEEACFHADRLREAMAIMQAAYPRLEIVSVYQDWETIREIARE